MYVLIVDSLSKILPSPSLSYQIIVLWITVLDPSEYLNWILHSNNNEDEPSVLWMRNEDTTKYIYITLPLVQPCPFLDWIGIALLGLFYIHGTRWIGIFAVWAGSICITIASTHPARVVQAFHWNAPVERDKKVLGPTAILCGWEEKEASISFAVVVVVTAFLIVGITTHNTPLSCRPFKVRLTDSFFTYSFKW